MDQLRDYEKTMHEETNKKVVTDTLQEEVERRTDAASSPEDGQGESPNTPSNTPTETMPRVEAANS